MSPVQLHWIAVANTEVHSMQGPEYVASRNLYKKELTRILTEVEALKDGKTSKFGMRLQVICGNSVSSDPSCLLLW